MTFRRTAVLAFTASLLLATPALAVDTHHPQQGGGTGQSTQQPAPSQSGAGQMPQQPGMPGSAGMMGPGGASQPGMMGPGMMGPGMMGPGMMGPGMMGPGMMGPGMMGPGMMGPGMMGHGGAGCAGMMCDTAILHGSAIDRIEGRIAYLRAELKITDAQSRAWSDFAAALRANAKKLGELRAPATAADAKPPTLTERLDQHERWLAARLEGTRAIKTTFNKLYGTFSNEQKKTAEELMAPAAGAMGAGMR